jgi:carbonic anhydrase
MSCLTPPLDIQTDGAQKCSLKCLLHYKYGDSACKIFNGNTMLRMTYDGASDIVYNNTKYTPTNIFIFKPSLHKYSGKSEAAELLIIHSSSQGGLIVSVPITVGGKLTRGSYLLKDIISAAPTSGTASPSIPDYNANYLIPSSRYFTYAGPMIKSGCNTSTFQYVVFHPRFGSVSIDKPVFDTLDKLLNPTYIAATKGDVFVNSTGTTSNGFAGDGQIYIDCQPTGESEEEVVYKESGAGVNQPPNDVLLTILLIVIGAALIYGTFRVMKLVLGNVNKVTSKSNLKG